MDFSSVYPRIFTVLFTLANPGFLEQIPEQLNLGNLFTAPINVSITSTIIHAIILFITSLIIIGGSGLEVNLTQHFLVTTVLFFILTPGVFNAMNLFNDDPVFFSKKTTLIYILVHALVFYGVLFLIYGKFKVPFITKKNNSRISTPNTVQLKNNTLKNALRNV